MSIQFEPGVYFSNYGYCVCCEQPVKFTARSSWLRDAYLCDICSSLPRERALVYWIEKYFPAWRDLSIHESSPIFRGASKKFHDFCKNYKPSHFFSDHPGEREVNGIMNINLEEQSLENESFDLVVTQDVFEHLYNPKAAFKEIARTLKRGGAHAFTVPLMNKSGKTQQWSERNPDNTINFFYGEEYHGNPIDNSGSPVAWHWGFDICNYIQQHTGMNSIILLKEDISLGMEAEYLEVIISFKS